MNDKNVAILMATFNGQKYIRDQIDSIITQTYTKWELYIRDDGSTDDTISIIDTYMTKDSRIHLISYPSSKQGACLNFYNLLKAAKTILPSYDYYFLSDQDDIWEKDKIEKEVSICLSAGNQKTLVYSDLSIMSADGASLEGKISDTQDINLKNPNNIFFNQIFVWGNTICINRMLLDFVRIPDDIDNCLSHDHYLTFYAAAFGTVIYVDEPLVRYRRHDDNVSGLPPKYGVISALKRFLTIRNRILIEHSKNYNNVIYFLEHAPKSTVVTNDIYNAMVCGGWKSIRVLRKYKIYPGNNKYNAMVNRIILFLGLHKRYLGVKK